MGILSCFSEGDKFDLGDQNVRAVEGSSRVRGVRASILHIGAQLPNAGTDPAE
jgi:hypothetical protein